MAQFQRHFVQELTKPIIIRQCGDLGFTGDNLSDVISVDLYTDGEAYSGGGTCAGACICPDGSAVPLTGTVSGKTASVTLTEDCFAIPGQIGIGIRVTTGTTKTTVLKAIYNVEQFATNNPVDPGSRISLDVADLINRIDAAVESIPASADQLKAAMAPNFSDTTPYAAGAYVWNNGTLYKFTTAHAAGSWTGTDATAVALGNDLAGKISDLNSTLSARLTARDEWHRSELTYASEWYIRADGTVGLGNTGGGLLLLSCKPNTTYTVSISPSYDLYKLAYSNESVNGGTQLYGVVSGNSSILSITTGPEAIRVVIQVLDATEVTAYEVEDSWRFYDRSTINTILTAKGEWHRPDMTYGSGWYIRNDNTVGSGNVGGGLLILRDCKPNTKYLAVISPSYNSFKLAYATSAIDLSSQLYGTVSNNSSVLSITTGNNATRLIMQVIDATEAAVYEVGSDSRLLSPSSIAPVENALTASTNYPTGSLILRNGVLCKTIVAVTRGVAWAVGTNIQATTLAAELALKANA